MTREDATFTRRLALKTTGGAVVGSGVMAGAAGMAAGREHLDDDESEDDLPEELPADIAEQVGVEEPAAQHQEISMHRTAGWTIRIVVTSDIVCKIHGGAPLDAYCTVRNNNAGGPHTATVWLFVGTAHDLVERKSIHLAGQTIDHVSIGYGTYPVRQHVIFPIFVVIVGPGGYDWDAAFVEVYEAR